MRVLKNMLSLYKGIVATLSYNQEDISIEQLEGEFKYYTLWDSFVFWWLRTGKKFFSVIGKWTGRLGKIVLGLVASPILILGLVVVIQVYKRLALKINSVKPKYLKKLQKLSFDEIKELETVTDRFFTKVTGFVHDLESAKDLWLFNKLYKYMFSIYTDLAELRIAAEKQYHFNMRELFSTEEEYQKYCEELKGLGDIWNYKSTENEQRLVYDLKKNKRH